VLLALSVPGGTRECIAGDVRKRRLKGIDLANTMSNGLTVMNKDTEGLWKEQVVTSRHVTSSKTLFQHCLRGAE
jgi:hypothetical protein